MKISNNFNEYPHFVYATAYLIDGKLGDYKIGDRERNWRDRTFRGFYKWENYVWNNFETANISCAYRKILVKDDKEHNEAFDTLEEWILNTFEKYEVKQC